VHANGQGKYIQNRVLRLALASPVHMNETVRSPGHRYTDSDQAGSAAGRAECKPELVLGPTPAVRAWMARGAERGLLDPVYVKRIQDRNGMTMPVLSLWKIAADVGRLKAMMPGRAQGVRAEEIESGLPTEVGLLVARDESPQRPTKGPPGWLSDQPLGGGMRALAGKGERHRHHPRDRTQCQGEQAQGAPDDSVNELLRSIRFAHGLLLVVGQNRPG
jgi:hypothetical protein